MWSDDTCPFLWNKVIIHRKKAITKHFGKFYKGIILIENAS